MQKPEGTSQTKNVSSISCICQHREFFNASWGITRTRAVGISGWGWKGKCPAFGSEYLQILLLQNALFPVDHLSPRFFYLPTALRMTTTQSNNLRRVIQSRQIFYVFISNERCTKRGPYKTKAFDEDMLTLVCLDLLGLACLGVACVYV